MPVRLETFQSSAAVATDELWAVVGDLWRLADWTDAERVADVAPDPPRLGTRVETVEARGIRRWQVVTWEPRLFELSTTTGPGAVGIGCRVVRDARGGSRLIIAAAVDTGGLAGAVRGRLLTAPSLRRRMDRWARAALDAAAASR